MAHGQRNGQNNGQGNTGSGINGQGNGLVSRDKTVPRLGYNTKGEGHTHS